MTSPYEGGAALKAARIAAGFTQVALAETMAFATGKHITARQISEMERGSAPLTDAVRKFVNLDNPEPESVAFKEGRDANRRGISIANNPHHIAEHRLDWANGYFAEQGGV